MAESNGPKVLSKDYAPYTDPGVAGQEEIKNESRTTTAPDEKVAGTPPRGTHPGNNEGDGERAASHFDQEEGAQQELGSRSQNTNDADEKLADA